MTIVPVGCSELVNLGGPNYSIGSAGGEETAVKLVESPIYYAKTPPMNFGAGPS